MTDTSKKNPCFGFTPNRTLIVTGTSPSLYPYAIEITDRRKAARWAIALARCRYTRSALGAPPKRWIRKGS
jgi:hypothetical protein